MDKRERMEWKKYHAEWLNKEMDLKFYFFAVFCRSRAFCFSSISSM